MAEKNLTAEQLQEKLTAAETENAGLKEEVKNLKEELATAQEVIEQLNGTNEIMVLQKKFKTDLPIRKINGKIFGFTADRFGIPGIGTIVSSEATEEQIEALLKIEGQGILVSLETAEAEDEE